MALYIQQDIAGSYITEEGFTVVHGLSSPVNMVLSNMWILPGGQGAIPKPINWEVGWASFTGKTKLADCHPSISTGWEEVARGDDQYIFIGSKGLAAGTIDFPSFDANQPLFLETFVYGVSAQPLDDYLIAQFGLYFKLHIHADGTADVEDLRPGAADPYLAVDQPLTAGGADLIGKLLQIAIIPWRRGRIMFVTNQGAYFEVNVGARLDHSFTAAKQTPGEAGYWVITETAQVTLTPNPAAKALVTVNKLHAISKTCSIGIRPTATPFPPTAPPIEQRMQAETQDGSTAVLSLTDGSGNPYNPTPTNRPDQIAWNVTLTSPTDAIFPQLFGVDIRFERGLGNRVYTNNNIGNPQTASLTLSRDRGQKSFSFTLDNPGEEWTSLKDLWNRKIIAFTVVDDIDPVAVELFRGYTDPAEFTDGSYSKITIPCSGQRKYLRYSLLSDSQSFDGLTHCQAVYRILHEAGIADTDIVLEEDYITLETADFGNEPLWRPANGQSRDEFICHICETFSGYIFDDIGGKFYYVSRDYFTRAAIAGAITIPQVYQVTPTDSLTHWPLAAARGPNPSIMVALEGSVRQDNQTEPLANDIWVLGRDEKTGEIVAAHYVDMDSIQTRTALNYVGERRTLIYASAGISSVDAAQQVLGILAAKVTQPIRPVTFDLPDLQISIPIDGPVNIEGFGLALITDITGADWSNDRWRRTTYATELL